MNRLKLIVLLIIAGIVGLLFYQNKQLLTLKLFCPEPSSEVCFWSSPELSLATWMGLFAIAGIISSLWGQLLNQAVLTLTIKSANQSRDHKIENRSSAKTKSQRDRPFNLNFGTSKKSADKPQSSNSSVTDWEEQSSENWEEINASDRVNYPPKDREANPKKPIIKEDPKSKLQSTQQPKSRANSTSSNTINSNQTSPDSVYSYKFSEPSKNKTTKKRNNNTDDVYDASYRTINNPSSKKATSQVEDDEEWI